MSHQLSASSGTSSGEVGPLTAIGGFALVFNLIGLYAFTGVALCVFGYIALTLILSSSASKSTRNPGAAEGGNVVMILSWVVALVGGVLVGGFHWVQYQQAAYAVLGMFGLATLIWIVGRAFDSLLVWLLPVVGVAMLCAVIQLDPPPGSDDMEKKESWTPITVKVLDESGNPIDGAEITLDLLHVWQGDPPLSADRKWWCKDKTGPDGIAEMALHEDPRFKRLLIRVQCEPSSSSFNVPTTIGACTGYVEARQQTILPAAKAHYKFEFVMAEREHPESALLAIELASSVENAHSVQVAITTEADLPWNEGTRTNNDSVVRDNGQLHDVYLSGRQTMVFKLSRNLAGRPLTLHLIEHDSSRYDDSKRVVRQIPIDPIPLGRSFTLPPINDL